MLNLDNRNITYLPGIGPKKADILQKELDIVSYEDLLYYFPYKYIDRSRFYAIREIQENMPYIQLKGRILSFEYAGEGRSKRLIGTFSDGTGTIDLIWFKGMKYVTEKLHLQTEYIVFGKPSLFGSRFNIAHPEVDPINQADQVAGGLIPFYNTTEKMKSNFINSRAIQNFQFSLLEWINGKIDETLPDYIRNRVGIQGINEAIQQIHFPQSIEKLKQAQLRLKFEELFYIQLNILRTARLRQLKFKGIVFSHVGEYFNTFYKIGRAHV